MSDNDKAAKLAGKKESLALVNELRASDAYQKIILPELLRRANHHTQACKNRDLTAEKRAEHVEAAHGFEEMVTYLDVLAKSLDETILQIQQGRK